MLWFDLDSAAATENPTVNGTHKLSFFDGMEMYRGIHVAEGDASQSEWAGESRGTLIDKTPSIER